MIRERLALRRRGISALSSSVLRDVISSRLTSTAESKLWPRSTTSVEAETALLEEHFRGLLASRWQGITDEDSLAGRVRRGVGQSAGAA